MRDPYDEARRALMEMRAELRLRKSQEEFLNRQQREMLSAVSQVPSMLAQAFSSGVGGGGGGGSYTVYTQDRAEPLERIVARPDHYCTTGDSAQAKADCTRCMDKLYGSTTGRPVPSGYHGWRDEYAAHGTPYAKERMLGLVDLDTEDVLTPKPTTVVSVKRATVNRWIRVFAASMIPAAVTLTVLDATIGSLISLAALFSLVLFIVVVVAQTKIIRRVEHRSA